MPEVLLFGSYSKGTANKGSDIDVAVIVPVEMPEVLLFGSYSKGTANKDNDIDVAVIVPSYGDRKLELSKALWHDVDDVSLLIEPVLIAKDHPSPRYYDVMRTGIVE